MTDPAGKASFPVSEDVEVVEVPPFFPECRFCVCELEVYQFTCVALETQRVGSRVIGNVLFPIKTFNRKGRLPLVNGMTVRAVALCRGLVKVPGIINISSNICVTFKAIAGRSCSPFFQEGR